MGEIGDEGKSVKCKRAILVLLLALVVTALLVGTAIAVTHTEVASVTRSLPDVVEPNAEFDVTLSINYCLLYTSPSPRDGLLSRMPSSA